MTYLPLALNALIAPLALFFLLYVARQQYRDLKDDQQELKQDIRELRAEIGGVRTELGGQIGALRTELGGEIMSLRSDITQIALAVGARPKPQAG